MTAKVTNRGKAVNCYFKDADLERVRTLAAFVASKGFRCTDSAIMAAALRLAKPNGAFLKAFEEGIAMDGRRKD